MSSGYIGSPTGNVIVPVSNFTKKTKQLDISSAIAITGTNIASPVNTRSVAIFYSDATSPTPIWRMRFNIRWTFTSANITTITTTFTGLTFKSGTYQNLSATFTGSAIPALSYTDGSTIVSSQASTSSTAVILAGDVELDADPTAFTTAANLESNVNVAAYVPSASASSAGLVDTAAQQLGAGIKTVSTDGLNFANSTASYTPAVLTYYETGSFSALFNQGAYTTGITVTVKWTRVGNLVCVQVPQAGLVTSNATASYWQAAGVVIPARISPPVYLTTGCGVYTNSNKTGGMATFDARGYILVQLTPVTNLAGNIGFEAFSFTYLV